MVVCFGSFKIKNMNTTPIYLFEKLGKFMAVSTATGDFYDIDKADYFDLIEWQKYVIANDSASSYQKLQESLEACDMPDDILEFFPPKLSEEDTDFTGQAKTAVTDITLNLTSECNLNCLYCWNDKGSYSGEGFISAEKTPKRNCDMTDAIAEAAVDTLLSLRGEETDLVVDFYGGEPLLNLDTILHTVKYCKAQEEKQGVTFSYLLATNGTLLTPEISKTLIELGVQIALSIDGPQAVHDHNRPFADGNGSFESILANLEKMPQDIRKKLVGRSTVTPRFPHMSELYQNLKDLGFERMEIFESEDACHKITDQRKDLFFTTQSDREVLYKEYEKLAQIFIDEVLEGKLSYAKTFFNRFFKLMQRLYYNEELTGGCPAATGQLAVSSDGKVYPCTSFLGIEKFCLGSVTEKVDKKIYEDFIAKINERFKKCSECDLYSVCKTSGSCLNINYFFNDDMTSPHEQSCEIFKEKIKLAIAALAIITEKIPEKTEELFGFDSVGRRGNRLY